MANNLRNAIIIIGIILLATLVVASIDEEVGAFCSVNGQFLYVTGGNLICSLLTLDKIVINGDLDMNGYSIHNATNLTVINTTTVNGTFTVNNNLTVDGDIHLSAGNKFYFRLPATTEYLTYDVGDDEFLFHTNPLNSVSFETETVSLFKTANFNFGQNDAGNYLVEMDNATDKLIINGNHSVNDTILVGTETLSTKHNKLHIDGDVNNTGILYAAGMNASGPVNISGNTKKLFVVQNHNDDEILRVDAANGYWDVYIGGRIGTTADFYTYYDESPGGTYTHEYRLFRVTDNAQQFQVHTDWNNMTRMGIDKYGGIGYHTTYSDWGGKVFAYPESDGKLWMGIHYPANGAWYRMGGIAMIPTGLIIINESHNVTAETLINVTRNIMAGKVGNDTYVNEAGDTMTGNLTINADLFAANMTVTQNSSHVIIEPQGGKGLCIRA